MSRENIFIHASEGKLDEVKLEVCRVLRHEILCSRKSQKQIAIRLGTSQGNISRVLNQRVETLTINQLFRYLAILKPKFKILVSPQ